MGLESQSKREEEGLEKTYAFDTETDLARQKKRRADRL